MATEAGCPACGRSGQYEPPMTRGANGEFRRCPSRDCPVQTFWHDPDEWFCPVCATRTQIERWDLIRHTSVEAVGEVVARESVATFHLTDSQLPVWTRQCPNCEAGLLYSGDGEGGDGGE